MDNPKEILKNRKGVSKAAIDIIGRHILTYKKQIKDLQKKLDK
tara:strand:+ start:1289 stop:1417 length:129 start_codon:yes stop_codon:yes gene_type:complete